MPSATGFLGAAIPTALLLTLQLLLQANRQAQAGQLTNTPYSVDVVFRAVRQRHVDDIGQTGNVNAACRHALVTAKGSEHSPAKDEALVHLVGINDALQHAGLQTLHCLGKTFWGVDVGPNLVKGMGLVCGGGGAGLQPGAVLMGLLLPKVDHQLSILETDGWKEGLSLHLPWDLECSSKVFPVLAEGDGVGVPIQPAADDIILPIWRTICVKLPVG
ncbi:MAG: hypothetical protein FRX49_00681 [Trebouxia sp. A1-2]|nr:MAG: hypothetical protein FRX49_00681 [Trebouxia sp. A1-2]